MSAAGDHVGVPSLPPAMDGAVQGRVLVRPIAPSDAAALVLFHDGLTGETTRLRFLILHPHLAAEEVVNFTRVDHDDRDALVAMDGSEIVAVGRYDRIAGTADAEVAFVVTDAWQGHGVGTLLLDHLAHRARAAGVDRFVADTLDENHRMRQLFRRLGPMTVEGDGAGVIRVTVDLERSDLRGR